MPFFRRGKRNAEAGGAREETRPLVGRSIWCRICGGERSFTRCWRRVGPVRQCPCCGLQFEDIERLYRQPAPACPRCAEPLEHPDFDYGFCDGCGSKFEIMEGTKPGLLPNKWQRAEMDKHGKTRTE